MNGTVGDLIEFKIPVGDEGATIELAGSTGASVDGNQFRWPPSDAQAGKTTFVAKIKEGDSVHVTRWNVHVDRPLTESLPIDFFVQGIDISNDESLIAVTGHQPTQEKLIDELKQRGAGEIAIFDAKSKTERVRKSTNAAIYQAEFCRNELLVKSVDSDRQVVVNRLKLPALSLEGQASVGRGELPRFFLRKTDKLKSPCTLPLPFHDLITIP